MKRAIKPKQEKPILDLRKIEIQVDGHTYVPIEATLSECYKLVKINDALLYLREQGSLDRLIAFEHMQMLAQYPDVLFGLGGAGSIYGAIIPRPINVSRKGNEPTEPKSLGPVHHLRWQNGSGSTIGQELSSQSLVMRGGYVKLILCRR